VYKLDSFVGFIGDEQAHAQECCDISACSEKNIYTKLNGARG
jgi:hypothetical protein